MKYDPSKMMKVLEMNKDNIIKNSNEYICEDDIYGILLKTGKYFNAIDNNYQNIIIVF